ncbi:four helix bundle protein [Flavobacterium sp.]|uniref:four helix bundle protein n=1 Tax=Flavobacterium sp. TaxID=239 RepID=UPI00260A772A|nr:four helix bundle protein [Flavobacterium sp.]
MVQDLKTRTKKFALDCWRLCRNFPHSREYNAYVNQLIRSSSSVGANYRASQRGKSTADFINKLKIVEEEADESHFFLEILLDLYDLDDDNVKDEMKRLCKEANELVAIIVASINTAKNKLK